jgi:hypothetical protein
MSTLAIYNTRQRHQTPDFLLLADIIPVPLLPRIPRTQVDR